MAETDETYTLYHEALSDSQVTWRGFLRRLALPLAERQETRYHVNHWARGLFRDTLVTYWGRRGDFHRGDEEQAESYALREEDRYAQNLYPVPPDVRREGEEVPLLWD